MSSTTQSVHCFRSLSSRTLDSRLDLLLSISSFISSPIHRSSPFSTSSFTYLSRVEEAAKQIIFLLSSSSSPSPLCPSFRVLVPSLSLYFFRIHFTALFHHLFHVLLLAIQNEIWNVLISLSNLTLSVSLSNPPLLLTIFFQFLNQLFASICSSCALEFFMGC